MSYMFTLTQDPSVLKTNPGSPSMYCVYVSDKRRKAKKMLRPLEARFPMVTTDVLDIMKEKSRRIRFLDKKKKFYFILARYPVTHRPVSGFGALQFEVNGEFNDVLIKNSEAELLMFIADYCATHDGLNVILDMSNLPNELVISHARNFAKRMKEVKAKHEGSFENLNLIVYVPEQE